MHCVLETRVLAFQCQLQAIVDRSTAVTACSLVRLTGMLMTMGLALGRVVRLWTRSLYWEIMQADHWDKCFVLGEEAVKELIFWQTSFDYSGSPIWCPSMRTEVLTYSDASASV